MFRSLTVGVVVSWALLAINATAATAERFFFLNNGAVLQGCVYKPVGSGPFPAVVFLQHVIKPLPEDGRLDPFPALGKFYTDKGYVLLVPGRHKVLLPGETPNSAKPPEGSPEANRMATQRQQLEAETLFAAVVALKAQSYVASDKVFLTGFGSGGVISLFMAEKDVDVRGCVVFSAASEAWKKNQPLRAAMQRAITEAKAPVFLIQPQNDFGLEPVEVLGKQLHEKGSPNRSKVFPPHGNGAKEAFYFGINAPQIWGDDVLSFFAACSRAKP